ncbi:hypothetical protein [Rhizobium leguminosarum]|nr:hypothetical protein [Rhizobium leguminosarum]MDI5929618.1 hypothetical protein [Rhizobium leguminosarum]
MTITRADPWMVIVSAASMETQLKSRVCETRSMSVKHPKVADRAK